MLITKGQTGVVTGYDSDNDVIVLYPSGKKWVYWFNLIFGIYNESWVVIIIILLKRSIYGHWFFNENFSVKFLLKDGPKGHANFGCLPFQQKTLLYQIRLILF